MDNGGISKEHWKIMFISGMAFFTDAYDLFIIGVCMALIKLIWHVDKFAAPSYAVSTLTMDKLGRRASKSSDSA